MRFKMLLTGAAVIAGASMIAAPAMAAPANSTAPEMRASVSAQSSGEVNISGPATAQAGKQFTIKGKTDKVFAGSKVVVFQNGKKFQAARTVGANGDISTRLVSNIKGQNKFQFKVIDGAGNAWPSNVITVAVR